MTLTPRNYAIIAAVAAVVIAVAVIAGLGTATNQTKERPLRIAVVTDALFSDKGWGAASLNASRFIKEKYGATVTALDNVSIADIESTLNTYAEERYDLIIAHGFQWGDPALRVGKQFPDVKIVVFTGLVQSDNVASIFPMQQEGSFLLGALAGMITKTNVVGFVGGEEYPNIVNIFEGYKQGAKYVNSDVKVIGTYLNDWDNRPKGKEAASSLIIIDHVDVIFHVADTSGHGVIDAAEQTKIYALGAVQDQNSLAPETVLTSFVLDVNKAYDQAVRMPLDGDFRGQISRPGIESREGGEGDGIVYLAPFHELDSKVPSDVKDRLGDLTRGILNGTISVPERFE